ncbi:DUF6265 family protein [Usitatibacter palustris]|uniref:DUF6265 domain-containing protein n=1 Tax=Usitatibacter palustris TaxID=2732487 RepID=A0A6M4H291_9PROT|nr:DUF6265 family protein [Usitatibacter palustris]QJR13435.1 hypothetical protein DSM104440_00218 [Usitatibacter palustris]
MKRLALLFAVLLPLVALAQATVAPAPATPAPTARIADVAWLQGSWLGEGMGGASEEFWMPARNGVMMGAFRVMKPDGSPRFYEIFAIEEQEGSLLFIVKHFTPEWVGWEEKDKATRLKLTAIAKGEATFGGVHFSSPDAQTLVVNVTLRNKDGTSRVETFSYRKRAS